MIIRSIPIPTEYNMVSGSWKIDHRLKYTWIIVFLPESGL